MHINQFTEVISACRFCFMCRHLSAVGQAGCREADTPRGRALIADSIRMHPEKIADADFVDTIYRSDLAGSNRFHCDGYHDGKGYDEVGLQLALRRDIVEAGTQPENVKKIADEFEKTADWKVEGAGDVLYFTDRYSQSTPEIAQSFAKLAEKGAVKYRTISGGCIGKVLRVLGYADRSKAVAKKFAAFINGLGAKTLVVSNPAAYDTLVNDYKEYGIELKVKVMHSSEFIANLKLAYKPIKESVGYIESDFLKNYVKNYPYPAELLKQIGAKCEPIGTNIEESYTAGEAAVVLPLLNPTLTGQLAGQVAKSVDNELLLTASPYTRRTLSDANLKVLTLEEFAAQSL
ncbi:MAG: (Fe-S)-binding protein [Victivallales bacterium]|jgi:Fe-S oxidoreductase|nr:(Fe-S)-binding protein [Victivallales bacterium]